MMEDSAGDIGDTVSRLNDDPRALYCCHWCAKFIGGRNSVHHHDKYDRVYCSSICMEKASSHPSRDYEGRGDY